MKYLFSKKRKVYIIIPNSFKDFKFTNYYYYYKMSAFSRNSNSNNNAKKPFCKVCADAGKTDTAHFVRATPDPNSAVVCPTLKALECRYCYKNGHTVKYCPVLKQNNKERDRLERQQRRVTAPTQPAAPLPPVKTGKFAMLENDSDDEQVATTTTFVETNTVQMPVIDYFPSLSASTFVAPVSSNEWASMAASVAHIPPPQPKPQSKPKPPTQQTVLYEEDDEEQDNSSEYDDAKLAIGDELYARIVNNHQSQAGMIVGMLLELEDSELMRLLQNSTELNLRVAECLEVLQDCVVSRARPVVYEDDDW